ncbi:L10e/P0 [Apostichopus japonicus]|uniref:Large ribosomal subunit protein uL10 n=1 Tax=Stichopus japonicus TaxID=307972 RepID=A0A2G8K5E1_STIJA|nr:L10e/P0 [Apostichopus japonicus]
MGKNTIMRKAIRGHLEHNPNLESLLPHLKGNVGLVFCKGDLADVRTLLLQNKVAAPAKAGAIAPVDVMVPAQNTGLGPEKTSFFQALSIATKISRGSIEILVVFLPTNTVRLLLGKALGCWYRKESATLKFEGIVVVYDNGSVFQPNILDITDAQLHERFLAGVRNVASVSLQIGYPTLASVPHSVVNGFKNVLALACATDIEFKEAEQTSALSRCCGRMKEVSLEAMRLSKWKVRFDTRQGHSMGILVEIRKMLLLLQIPWYNVEGQGLHRRSIGLCSPAPAQAAEEAPKEQPRRRRRKNLIPSQTTIWASDSLTDAFSSHGILMASVTPS